MTGHCEFKRSRSNARILLILLLSVTVRMAFSQAITATISGTCTDKTGAILPGATITITNLDTAFTRTLLTDANAHYHAPGLPIGNYEVTSSLSGFKTEVRTGIKMTVGREAVVDFVLEVGTIQERVVVTGEAPLVETANAAMGELVDERKIRDLPLNGRDITQLIQMQLGVNVARSDQGDILTGGKGSRVTVAGVRPSGNVFMLDGTIINNMGNRVAANATGQLTGVETIKEFKVITSSYSAEFSRVAGGVFNIVTKSGSNEFHGSVFEFLRNDDLDARNFFDPGDTPEFKRNQFGFSLGGPIARDKSFFFGSYEGLRQGLGVTAIRIVPDLDSRNGIVAGKRVEINPVVRPYLDAWPRPTSDPVPGDGSALFTGALNQDAREDFFTVRVDHKLSDASSLAVRYTFANSSQLFMNDETFPQFPNRAANRAQYLTLQETRIFSSSAVNEFRFGFARSNPFEDIATETPLPQLAFIPGQPIGTIAISGFDRFGTDRNVPRKLTQNSFQLSENLTIVKGRHSFKLGFNGERLHYNVISSSRARGEFTFSNLPNFLQARPRTFEGLLPQASDFTRGYRQNLFGWYIQDDFRMTRRLVFNYGLRHEFVTVPTEQHDRLNNLHDPLDPKVTIGKPFITAKKNFAPRLGFAWDLTGNAKMSLRGGFGVFFDQFLAHQWYNSIVRLPPFAITARASGADAKFPNALAGLSPLARDAVFAVDFDHGQPYIYQYNLNLQREVLPDTVVTLAYVGSRGIKLPRESDWNIGSPGRPTARNRNFTRIRFRTWDANSFYNSFQLGINKRYSRGFQMQGSYTYSKSVDDMSSPLGRTEFNNGQQRSSDPFNRKGDRGLSSFDVRHSLTINYTLDLPFGAGRRFGSSLQGLAESLVGGWQLNGIVTLSSGLPFTPIIVVDLDRDGTDDNEQRPNLKAGRSNNPRLGRPEQWFDPSAFESIALGTRGNLGRNTLIGPGLATFDFSLVKNVKIRRVSEDFAIQFKTEFFNLFNRANFALPPRTNMEIFTDAGPAAKPLPAVGRITNTVTTARQIQFALKVIF